MLPKVIQTNLALLHHPAEKPTSGHFEWSWKSFHISVLETQFEG